MTKPLKVEIDRPTLGCLIIGFNELSHEVFEEYIDSYEKSVTYHLLGEMFEKMADSPRQNYYTLKLSMAKAFAMRHLITRTQPMDEWTNANLVDLTSALDKFIINNEKIEEIKGPVFTVFKLN